MKKNKLTDKHFTENHLGRRAFLKKAGTFLGGMTLVNGGFLPVKGAWASETFGGNKGNNRGKLIFIAIDGLHPKYLELDARGLPGGSEGNRLMPNIHAFLKKSLWYPNAKCYLPSATDMNHLNALAGTSSAQTGIISVWAQPTGWNANGEAIVSRTNISFARDDKGNPVDTLFQAWKRKRPESKTLLVTGKAWVGEMLRGDGSMPSGIDILVTGASHPDYLPVPPGESLVDPPTDADAACDPESSHLGFFGKNMNPSHVMTRLFTGQGAVPARHMEQVPEQFPHDSWIVDSALETFRREKPDMAYILLAQCDDACHAIGNAWDRSEFVNADPPYVPPEGCENKPEYQLVSSRNKLLFREAILDVIRDVDIQFGRLLDGLKAQGVLDGATVILLSDHSAENHLYTDDFSSTDFVGLLEHAGLIKKSGILTKQDMYSFSASSFGVLYWRENKENIPAAKKLLLTHTALNPETNLRECPWWVLDRDDMKKGVAGVCLPGELYHTYYVEVDKEKTMIWPDLIILAKNGWQVPVYNGQIPNIGVKVPRWTPPWRVVNGGHGSVDTLPIVAAISVPGGKTGINGRPIRISDLAVTAAALSGLTLKSSTVGRDLSKDLK
jgi:predicted AlkP superfamily pyrophosphatase or phosphodiesterase